jgi:uncharacterized cupin superfamily protein
MSEQRPILFEREGPTETSLVQWPAIDHSNLTAGEPVQRGHTYFDDDTGTLTCGVWECTPMTTKLHPHPVNEFMYILGGVVTIVDQSGNEETISAGQSFVLPKGMPRIWKQTETVRKFYVIFNDPSGIEPEDPSDLAIARIDPAGALSLVDQEKQDTSRYDGRVPTQHIHAPFNDLTGQLLAGVWDTASAAWEALACPEPIQGYALGMGRARCVDSERSQAV